MSEPDEGGNESGVYDAEAYDADHDPVEDVPGAGAGQEAILGSGWPAVSGQESIELSQDASEEDPQFSRRVGDCVDQKEKE